jgi:hypothetical protein
VRVRVSAWNGARFRLWALPSCTISGLRAEAARAWGLRPADAFLADARNGAAWPDGITVHEALEEARRAAREERASGSDGEGEGRGEDDDDGSDAEAGGSGGGAADADSDEEPDRAARCAFVLRLRDTEAERFLAPSSIAAAARAQAPVGASGGGATEREGEDEGAEGAAPRDAASHADDGGTARAHFERAAADAGEGGAGAAAPALPRPPFISRTLPDADAHALAAFPPAEPRLWRIFTYYAAAGDASEPLALRARQWRCLLDDAGLLAPSGGSAAAALPSPVNDGTAGAFPRVLTPETADMLFAAAAASSSFGGASAPRQATTTAAAAAARRASGVDDAGADGFGSGASPPRPLISAAASGLD